MNHVEKVVKKFGGTAAMAASLTNDNGGRLTPRTVVEHWIRRGRIPAHRQVAILKAAAARRIRLRPGELVEPVE